MSENPPDETQRPDGDTPEPVSGGAWVAEPPTSPDAAGGAYPPPPAGAYPPPPAGAYPPPAGAYPPPAGAYPPPAGAYGSPYTTPYGGPGGMSAVGVGEAFNYGWTKFTQNIGTVLLGVLGYAVVFAVLSFIAFVILASGSTVTTDAYGNTTGGLQPLAGFTGLLLVAVMAFLAVFMQAGVIRAALEITYGHRIEFATFFRFTDVGKVVVAVLLVGVLTAVGYLLFFLPGLVFAFFAQFTLFFVLDKGLPAVEALRASFQLVNRNVGTVLLLFLAVYVANAVGSAFCGIGALVAFPVGLIATTFVYRRLLGEPVAA